jgi:hypothetical protein
MSDKDKVISLLKERINKLRLPKHIRVDISVSEITDRYFEIKFFYDDIKVYDWDGFVRHDNIDKFFNEMIGEMISKYMFRIAREMIKKEKDAILEDEVIKILREKGQS